MSHILSEADSFDPAVITPDPLDIDYTDTIPQGLQALTNRTNNLATTLGAIGNAWEQQSESFFVADTDGSFSIFLPQTHRATPLRSVLSNLACKILGLRQLRTSDLAAAAAANAALTAGINTVLADLANTQAIYGAQIWGIGRNEVWTWLPMMLDGDGVTTDWFQPPTTTVSGHAGAVGVRQNTANANEVHLYVPPLPAAAKIDYVEIACQGEQSHGSISGMTMPTLKLQVNDGAGGSTSLATGIDTSANAAAYEAFHSVRATVSGGAPVYAGQAYMLTVTGETGGPAIANSFFIASCRIRLK